MTGRTDVRLITATNRDLRKQIEGGQFREDLYYRLNVIQIAVPPLRQRGDDILLLLRYYLQRASEAHRLPLPELTPDAEQLLLALPVAGQHPRAEEHDRAAGRARERGADPARRSAARERAAKSAPMRRRDARRQAPSDRLARAGAGRPSRRAGLRGRRTAVARG